MSESPTGRGLGGRTVLVTGASRGIGRAIALRVARDGARVALLAKTETPHPELPGTIHTVADEVEAAGGRALPLAVDVRFEDQVEAAVERTVREWGGIDVVVNNAGAIDLTGTLETPVKRFDLMHAVNVRATFVCTRAAVPHLREAANPHVVHLAPPPTLESRWLAPQLPYALSKLGMSLCVIGMAEEFRADGIAVNGLWPRTVIATAALRRLGGRVEPRTCRTPEIVADALHALVLRDSRTCTGRFFLDEDVLREEGTTSFDRYAVDPTAEPTMDLFVAPDPEPGSADRDG